jgi:hypothetical protein
MKVDTNVASKAFFIPTISMIQQLQWHKSQAPTSFSNGRVLSYIAKWVTIPRQIRVTRVRGALVDLGQVEEEVGRVVALSICQVAWSCHLSNLGEGKG